MIERVHGAIENLTEEEIRAVLHRGSYAHLGCRFRRDVYVVPISYAFDGECLYGHSGPGRKIDIMRANPRVCLQIEEVSSPFHWRSVIVWGTYEELDATAGADAMQLLMKKIGKSQHNLTPLDVEISAILSHAVIYRIRIEKMTGRKQGHADDKSATIV